MNRLESVDLCVETHRSGSHLTAEHLNLVRASGLQERRESLNTSSVSSSLHNTSASVTCRRRLGESTCFVWQRKTSQVARRTRLSPACRTLTDVLFSSSCLKSLYRLSYFRGSSLYFTQFEYRALSRRLSPTLKPRLFLLTPSFPPHINICWNFISHLLFLYNPQ